MEEEEEGKVKSKKRGKEADGATPVLLYFLYFLYLH